MSSWLSDWIIANREKVVVAGKVYYRPAPKILCADGLEISVQASHYHYCSPRTDNALEYYEVEVGFPSEKIEEFMEYAEDSEDPTGTVYANVPVELVEAVIAAHGGND